MRTVVYPKPFFDENPFKHPDGKIASTYVRPKERKIEFTPFIPNGPSKTLVSFQKKANSFQNFHEKLFNFRKAQ